MKIKKKNEKIGKIKIRTNKNVEGVNEEKRKEGE